MRIAVALILALGVRATYALPTQFISALRAATCCAKHCPHSTPLPTPARCCAVPQDATDQTRTVAPQSDVAPPTVLLSSLDVPELPAPLTIVGALPAGHERAGPIFLLTCSLQR